MTHPIKFEANWVISFPQKGEKPSILTIFIYLLATRGPKFDQHSPKLHYCRTLHNKMLFVLFLGQIELEIVDQWSTRILPIQTAKNQMTCVTLTFDLLTEK